MTSGIDYINIDENSKLQSDMGSRRRAVRVKSKVAEKIASVSRQNTETKEVSPVEQATPVEQTVTTGEVSNDLDSNASRGVLDLSEDTLSKLNGVLNDMQGQRIQMTGNRGVLFTKPLVSKVKNVSANWLGAPVENNSLEEQKEEVPQVETTTPSMQSSGVVPGSWDDIASVINQQNAQVEVPQVEVPSIEIPSLASLTDAQNAPEVVAEPEVPEVAQEIAAPVENNSEVNEQPMDFVPEPTDLTEHEDEIAIPTNEENSVEINKEENPSDLIPEPTPVEEPVNEVSDSQAVMGANEGISVDSSPVSEENESTNEVETDKLPDFQMLVNANQGVTVDSVSLDNEIETEPDKEVETSGETEQVQEAQSDADSIKNRVSELIKNREDVQPKVYEETAPDEKADRDISANSSNELSQASILAKLQRINNVMKEKDAKISSLTSKYDSAKEDLTQAKSKISGYEAVVNDLTMKNRNLTTENERLSSKLSDIEKTNQSKVSRLETRIEELEGSSSKLAEDHKKTLASLEEQHAEEIEALKRDFDKKLQSALASKDKQIKSIYATISQALGEQTIDEYEEQKTR